MARKLIKDIALEQAMAIFWENGFNGTSMDMLTKGLGVEKPSIYATFGNKRALFLAALTHYRTVAVSNVRAALEAAQTAGTPKLGLERVVRFMMTSIYQPGVRSGCFATNAALELADQDPEVAEHLSTMLREMRQLFEHTISKSQQCGQIPSQVSAALLASYLVNAIEGGRVLEKTKPSPEALDELVTFILRVLN